MKHVCGRPIRRHAVRLALLLLLPVVGLGACDDNTGPDADSIQGTWVLIEGSSTVFLEITSNTIEVYDRPDDCFYRESYSYENTEGDEYELTGQSGFSLTLTIRREGDNLVIGFVDGETDTFRLSNQNVDELEICTVEAGGGDDPSIDCSSLPEIAVGQTINGELTTSDDSYLNRYFDLYKLVLGSQTSVQIDAMSSSVDTFLYLYESDGTYIWQNDDGGDGFNSRINVSLPAGCYRVEVTSFDSNETGMYSLSVF